MSDSLDLFTDTRPKKCAECDYLCQSLGLNKDYYCDRSKKPMDPNSPGCPLFQGVRV